MAQQTIAADNVTRADPRFAQACAILLQPVSHPDLGEIRIDDELFAIGRTEAPFASYPQEVVSDLSRRHARIFAESGTVYLADLDSKNGTTVNGVSVQHKITRLRDGDEISFAGRLSYRVRLRQMETTGASRSARLASLTLIPEHGDLGLQPIVISRFPFLISKTDDAFARYKQAHPHQVNYLSRRHAHIFIKGADPFIEDLGSTNGTFVNGKRLDEHAVRLQEGDVLAVGGHHFVYKLSLQREAATLEPTVTRLDAAMRGMPTVAAAAGAAIPGKAAGEGAAGSASAAAPPQVDADKTTFVAAAGSFLDIFCVEHVPRQRDEAGIDAPPADADAGNNGAGQNPAQHGAARGRIGAFAAEFAEAFSGGERRFGLGAKWWRWPALAGGLLVVAALFYMAGSPERELRGMLADGEYAEAASTAAGYLAREPDQVQVRALGTEALLKSALPRWQALLKARQFKGADAVLAEMKRLARDNADVKPLLAELEWVGQLEQFVAARGGADQPVRDAADAERLRQLLGQWDDDTLGHQQAFTTISSYVPEFRDQYAQALSHVRKLALVNGQQAKGGQVDGEQQRQPSEIAH